MGSLVGLPVVISVLVVHYRTIKQPCQNDPLVQLLPKPRIMNGLSDRANIPLRILRIGLKLEASLLMFPL